MLFSRVAKLLSVAVLFVPACSKSSSSSDDSPPVVIYQVQDIQLTSLAVDSRQEHTGELSNQVTVQVNFPIHIAFGVTQTGGVADTQFAFGLMQQLSLEEAAAANGNQRVCFLGSTGAHHPGDGKEMQYEATFVVPPECAPNNEPTTYNLYVGIDAPGQVRKTESDEDATVVIYNEDYLEESRNQNCKLGDGTTGCILSVTVNPSPGVNLSFASMELESNVAILSPLDENTGGVDANGDPVPEIHTPFAKAISTIALAGVNTDDATAITNKNAAITYSVCAESLYHTTCRGDGWLPLTISSVDSVNKRSGHSNKIDIPELHTGQPKFYTNFLYAEGATYEAMMTGAWAVEEKFVVRGCVKSDVEEKATGTDDGSVALLDNCKTHKVVIVRDDNSENKAFATFHPGTLRASAYTFTENFVQKAGDAKTVQVATNALTENILNLDGASTRNMLELGLAGKVNIKAVRTVGSAAAYVAVAGSFAEIQHQMLNVTLYSLRQQIQDSYTKEATLGIVREGCSVYGLNLLVIVVQGSMCVGGKAGFDGVFNVKSVPGGQAPFNAATKTGIVSVTFGPVASVFANTRVSGGNEIARGGVEGNVRLIEATVPNTIALQWGLTNVNPPALGIKGTVTSKAELAIIDGEIVAFADLREIDMCSKSWKIFGKRHRIRYPCGFRWDRKYEQKLVNFTGDKRGVTLLSRSETSTLQ